jgi:hypothetical protein
MPKTRLKRAHAVRMIEDDVEREPLFPEPAAGPDVVGLDRLGALQEQVAHRIDRHHRGYQQRRSDRGDRGEQQNACAHARIGRRGDEDRDRDCR